MFKNFNGFHLLEAYQHRKHHEKSNQSGRVLKQTVEAIVVVLVTLLLWNLPSDSFGIEGLNVVQQRIIAIFVFATLMWVLEVVPSWATSVSIIGLMIYLIRTFNFGGALSRRINIKRKRKRYHSDFDKIDF